MKCLVLIIKMVEGPDRDGLATPGERVGQTLRGVRSGASAYFSGHHGAWPSRNRILLGDKEL